jgi:hypothetical protein
MAALSGLIGELKVLRRGRGVLATDIHRRLGPELRAACDVREDDEPGHVRRKLVTVLENVAVTLPPDLRLAVMVGFGLAPESRFPRYEDRVDWVARKLGHVSRTARRRVDEGVQHVAEMIAESLAAGVYATPQAAWRTTDLWVEVALDQPRPEVVEHRRIVSQQPALAELSLAVTLAPRTGFPEARLEEPHIEVVHGGVLGERGMESSDRFGFIVTLPHPLDRGEPHAVACRCRLSAGMLRPYLACVPRQPCDRFTLRVRFGESAPAPRVWLLRGVLQRDVGDDLSPGEELSVDPNGDIQVRFRNLSPGLAYGLRWS